MVRQLGLTNIEADTGVYPVQPSSVLLKAWLLIGQWRVDKLQWRAYVLLMDDRYCSMHPKLWDPWTLRNQQCCSLEATLESPSFPAVTSERRSGHFCTWSEDRCSSGRALLCQCWLTSAQSFCGKVAAGPQKHWPIHRSEAGWGGNSQLSLLVSEPSSQAPRTIVTWKNVGWRCWFSDQHADEETFYLRARDMAGSGVTYVHTHTRTCWCCTNGKDQIYSVTCATNHHQFTYYAHS